MAKDHFIVKQYVKGITLLILIIVSNPLIGQNSGAENFLKACYTNTYPDDPTDYGAFVNPNLDSLLFNLELAEQAMQKTGLLKEISPQAYKNLFQKLLNKQVDAAFLDEYTFCCTTPAGVSLHRYCLEKTVKKFQASLSPASSIARMFEAHKALGNGADFGLQDQEALRQLTDAINQEDFDKFLYRAPLVAYAISLYSMGN